MTIAKDCPIKFGDYGGQFYQSDIGETAKAVNQVTAPSIGFNRRGRFLLCAAASDSWSKLGAAGVVKFVLVVLVFLNSSLMSRDYNESRLTPEAISMLLNWKRYIGEIATLVCAVVLLYYTVQGRPWLNLEVLEIKEEPLGFYLNFVYYAGWAALGLAFWGIILPEERRLTSGLTLIAGLVGFAYYPLLFYQNMQIGERVMWHANLSFWIVLVACASLVIQFVVPRPSREALAIDAPPGFTLLRPYGFWSTAQTLTITDRVVVFVLFLVIVPTFLRTLLSTPFVFQFVLSSIVLFFLAGKVVFYVRNRRKPTFRSLAAPELFVNTDRLRPGDMLEVIYRQKVRQAINIDSLHCALVLRESYSYSKEDFSITETHDNLIKSETRRIEGDRIEQKFSFVVPPEASHTFLGYLNKLEWLLMLKLFLPGQSEHDAVYNYKVTVLPEMKTWTLPRPGLIFQIASVARGESLVTVDIQVDLERQEYLPGETVRGEATITADKDIKCRKVTLRLEWFSTIPQGIGHGKVVASKMITSGGLRAGQLVSDLFEFTLPDAPWSYAGPAIDIFWAISVTIHFPFIGSNIEHVEQFIVFPTVHRRCISSSPEF